MVCRDMEVEQVHRCLEQVEALATKRQELEFTLQSIVCACDKDTDVAETVRRATRSLRTKKLLDKKSSHSDTLSSLIQALQECDKDTESHVMRTQKMGMLLGRKIGLSDEEMNNLALLAVLHDIGKIGIPLEILNKPSKLSESEWRLMKTHVEKGYQIASSSTEFRDIAEMILYHHERWDGKGYPDGLSKESIPLLSRIISVVDAYDAMTNDRAYHTRMSHEQACRELKRNAGTQFDPNIVSVYIKVLEEAGLIEAGVEQPAEEKHTDATEDRSWSANAHHDTDVVLAVHEMDFCSYIMEQDMSIVSVDDRFEALTGYTWQEVQENHITQIDLLPEEDREDYMRMLARVMDGKDSAFLEHRIRCKDGQVVYVYCYGTQYYDSSVRKMRTKVTVSNVANSYAIQNTARMENSRSERRLKKLEDKFRRDPLTGLLHHEAFKNDVESELLSGEHKAMMLMVDVDNFKDYNDRFGHLAGDEYLLMVARNLSKAIREDDLAGRMGGDEFAAMLFFAKDADDKVMVEAAQRIFDKINVSLAAQAGHMVSVSIGGALAVDGTKTFDQLYQAADQALYRAKRSGRARLSM